MEKKFLVRELVTFRWSYSGKEPYIELSGQILSDDGDQVAVHVVDSNLMNHTFHVMKKDVIA